MESIRRGVHPPDSRHPCFAAVVFALVWAWARPRGAADEAWVTDETPEVAAVFFLLLSSFPLPDAVTLRLRLRLSSFNRLFRPVNFFPSPVVSPDGCNATATATDNTGGSSESKSHVTTYSTDYQLLHLHRDGTV